ncbi:MAG: flavodoxin-dependent (E)-4-hydroxy-3-methylbut-2-enyl-diphosphate synthase [Sedimentisphaerales bacterium]|jgi:(E)-4-hydroxy-3-methylbut-2-enyl-diphosphate synthase
MFKRKKTRTIDAGSVKIGSSSAVVIQSMTKVPTTDVGRCVRQINQLAEAGCRLVRVAVPTRADTTAFAQIVQKVNIPLIADIHFSPQRAVEAIEAGAAKIRLNPGNIKNRDDILRIIDAAKMHKVAIRIGVNEASIRDLGKPDVVSGRRVALMLKELKGYVRLFEGRGFSQIVLSAKSSDTIRTIEINRRIAETFDYPIHLGLTHAGLPEDACVPSAVTLGTLLAEGIGDTIRVSAAGDPVIETGIAKQILISLGLYPAPKLQLIVCPTCARTEIDIAELARKVKKAVSGIDKPFDKAQGRPVRIAVMGCIVNGPGEAADADLAVCAAKNKVFIYRKGKKIATVAENRIIPMLLRLLNNL